MNNWTHIKLRNIIERIDCPVIWIFGTFTGDKISGYILYTRSKPPYEKKRPGVGNGRWPKTGEKELLKHTVQQVGIFTMLPAVQTIRLR